MKTYLINDNEFKKTDLYKDYMRNNKGIGYLKIRAFTANEAIPIKDLKIVVKKTVDNSTIIFYEGVTDESGMINNIPLPTIKNSDSNLISPEYSTYDIICIYEKENLKQNYQANIFDNIYTIQNINIIPKGNWEEY